MDFWRKLNYLVPEPQCRTRGGVIVEWTDVRPRPTPAQILAVDIADVETRELDTRAGEFTQPKKALAAMLEIIYENPDLDVSFATVQLFKQAVKERYKMKL